MSEEQQEYSMLMRFVDQTENFCCGFEAGKMWEQLKDVKFLGTQEEPLCFHTINIAQFELMAKSLGFQFEYWQCSTEGWTYGKFTKLPPVPPKLAVVK